MIRAHLFCHIDDQAAADGVLSSIFGGDQTGSFSVLVGETHYGCSGVLRNEALAAIVGSSVIQVYTSGSFQEAAADVIL